MDESPRPPSSSRELLAWLSLAVAIVVPLLGALLVFGVQLPFDRSGGRTFMYTLALLEFSTLIAAAIGFVGSHRNTRPARLVRLLLTFFTATAGTFWLIVIAELAGSGNWR